MSTFTKEKLIQHIGDMMASSKEMIVGNGVPEEFVCRAERDIAVYEIALASLEAEPVAYIDPFTFKNFSTFRAGETDNKRMGREWAWANPDAGLVPVYTAPPAPVSVPDEATPENIEILASTFAPRGVTYQWDRDECNAAADSWNACRAAMLQGAEPVSQHPELTVWYGSMPETNGKTNWTAILHRKGESLSTGITVDCSEYPDRVRYEADRMRYLIGELADEPDILTYDADAHSGHVKPGNSPAIPDGYALVPIDMAPQMMRAVQINSELGAYAAANLSGAYSLFREFWDVAIAAAPQQEVK